MDLSDLLKEFKKKEASLLVYKNSQVKTYSFKGIKPLLELERQGVLKDAFIIDKISGEAASCILVKAKAKKIHAFLISTPAIKLLKENDMEFTYEKEVPHILNKERNDLCPMEKLVSKQKSYENKYLSLCKLFKLD